MLELVDQCVLIIFIVVSCTLYYGGYFFPATIGPYIGLGTLDYFATLAYIAVRVTTKFLGRHRHNKTAVIDHSEQDHPTT